MSDNIPISFRVLQGLNTNAGSLKIQDKESTNLENVDFNRLGSVLKRRGYYHLNATAVAVSGALPYVPGTDNPPPIAGDTGDFGIPLMDLGYGIRFSTRIVEEVFIPSFTLNHSASLL